MKATVGSISATLSGPTWKEMALGEEHKLVSWKQQMEYEIEPKATDACINDQFTGCSLVRKLWVILKTANPVSTDQLKHLKWVIELHVLKSSLTFFLILYEGLTVSHQVTDFPIQHSSNIS